MPRIAQLLMAGAAAFALSTTALAAPAAADDPKALTVPAGEVSGSGSQADAGNTTKAKKYYFETYATQPSFRDRQMKKQAGYLYPGNNYFYCQQEGISHYFDHNGNRYFNTWWAKTDDDSGNKNVWVSATAFKKGDNWKPIPGLPKC